MELGKGQYQALGLWQPQQVENRGAQSGRRKALLFGNARVILALGSWQAEGGGDKRRGQPLSASFLSALFTLALSYPPRLALSAQFGTSLGKKLPNSKPHPTPAGKKEKHSH